MLVRSVTLCSLITSALTLGGCMHQSPSAGLASRASPDGLNTWQRYELIRQAKRVAPPAPSDLVRTAEPVDQRRFRGGRELSPGTRVATRRIIDCEESLRDRRQTIPEECVVAQRGNRRTLARRSEDSDSSLNTRSLDPTVNVSDGGTGGGTSNPTQPGSNNIGPSSGPAIIDSPSLNPVNPSVTTVANVPAASVPLNQNRLPSTPTQRFIFSPAPSTPRPPTVATPTITRPSIIVRDVLNSVRR
jgi:hypothetical protein